MGTNYYLQGKPPCEHCGRHAERGLHIGKSSGGWAFALRIYARGILDDAELTRVFAVIGKRTIESLDDWCPLFERLGAVNEYGDEVDVGTMMATIAGRPGELRRHVELSKCLPVQVLLDDTYDLVEGEFS